MLQFYADNGIIVAEDANKVQYILNIIKDDILAFGLETKIDKTEMMVTKANKNIRI